MEIGACIHVGGTVSNGYNLDKKRKWPVEAFAFEILQTNSKIDVNVH